MRYQAALLPVANFSWRRDAHHPWYQSLAFLRALLDGRTFHRSSLLLRSANRIAQCLAGGERRNLARGNDQRLACLGITAFALFALANHKAAEWNELDFVAGLEGGGDLFQQQVDDFAALPLRKLKLVRQSVDEI